MKKLIILLLPVVLLCLGGCETRECIKSHIGIGIMPVLIWKAIYPMPRSIAVCDEYSWDVK